MSTTEPFSNPIYEEQMHLAERELSTFFWDQSANITGCSGVVPIA
jgi:hypothetical protein